MNDDVTERGIKFFEDVMGAERAVHFRAGVNGDGFGSAAGKLAADFAFGSVWTRDGLERKQRSLVVIGALIAQHAKDELKNHFRIGLANGLTAREIEEVVIQTIPYCGFPAGAQAMSCALEVLREAGIDTTSRTSQEKGLL